MIALPVCRWRKEQVHDRYVCRSTKFVNAPNLVSEAFCAKCYYADHEPTPPPPRTLPCVHRGERQPGSLPSPVIDLDISRGLFACALHGICTPGDPVNGQSSKYRSCARCADYLERPPFGPDSGRMRQQAEEYLAAIPAYPAERYQGRGVVFAAGGDRFFPALYISIRALRHFGCHLPIQVWYLGHKHEMPAKSQALLAPFNVQCIDADRVRRRQPARRLGGWELKVFATLHCSFEEVLFLDADCYPCRNPEFLFQLEDYRAQGAIFWPDIRTFDNRLKWSAFGVADPKHAGSVESGQFLINKKQCWQPLNLAWFYNDHSDYYYRYGFGDKHTFEVAWTRCARPYVMWQSKALWVDVAYVHAGPDGLPLFVHRCSDKFRFDSHVYSTMQYHPLPRYYSSIPLERECWTWMSELARLTGSSLALDQSINRFYYSRKRQPGRARFAVATLYTAEFAELGQSTSKVLRAYAQRHRYDAIVATEKIDASRPPSWSKLLLIERYLIDNPDCSWLLWIDADAVIANPGQRLEDLVDDQVDFIVAADRRPSPMNARVFLIRNCPATLEMLRLAYAKVQYTHHSWWEQLAVAEAARQCADTLRTQIVPRRSFVSLADEYQAGDFIIHFAGLAPDTKLAAAKKAIASALGRRSQSQSTPHELPAGKGVRDLLPPTPGSAEWSWQPSCATTRPVTDLPPMYCITCSQTPQRRTLAVQHFSKRGLDVQFFPGIHGKTFGLRSAHHSGSTRMLAGEVGCLLSHYMLWQTLAYLPHQEVLILEDDAWFVPKFTRRFLRAYADLPEDWQFVFVGIRNAQPVEKVTDRIGVMRYPAALHAYLVKRAVLPFLLETNHQARKPLDLQLMENTLPALKCYTFTPPLVKQRSICSPVDGTGENWPSTIGIPDDNDDRLWSAHGLDG